MKSTSFSYFEKICKWANLRAVLRFLTKFSIGSSLILLTSCKSGVNTITGFLGRPITHEFAAKLTINNGDSYTNQKSAQLTLEALGASDYSLHTSLMDCLMNENWQSMSASTTMDLPGDNSDVSIYVKYRTEAGDISNCVSDDITHDDMDPLPPTALDVSWSSGVDITKSPTLNFNSALDRGPSDYDHYESRILDASTGAIIENWATLAPGDQMQGLTQLLPSTSYILELRGVDRAGNYSSSVYSRTWSDTAIAQTIMNEFNYFSPGDSALADIDQDGDLDLVMTDGGSNKLIWMEMIDASGTLANPKVLIDGFVQIKRFTLADIDNDGYPDVVSGSLGAHWYKNEFQDYGGFGRRREIDTIGNVENYNVAIANDLDSDGDLDVAISYVSDNTLAWYENLDGKGNFSAPYIIVPITGVDPGDLKAGDIDNDGMLDLVVLFGTSNSIGWFKNLGSGNFAPEAAVANTTGWVLHLADFDGDGDMDVYSSTFWVENSDGLGTFTTQTNIAAAVDTGYNDVGDFNGDGSVDLALTYESGISEQFSWTANNGSGSFGPRIDVFTLPFGEDVTRIHFADKDGDGDLDILAIQADPDGVWWIENTDGAGTTAAAVANGVEAMGGILGLKLGDIDGDGDLDAVVGAGGGIYLFKNTNGMGGFSTPTQLTSTLAAEIIFSDVDKDGDQDLVYYGTNKVAWLKNLDGLGGMSAEISITTSVTTVKQIQVADINGDTFPDVLSASSGDGKVAWYPNDGAGNIGAQLVIANLAAAGSIAVGDIDGDGDLDVASHKSTNTTSVRWYRNTDGLGTFSASVQSLAGHLSINGAIWLTDVDADGDQDLFGFSQNNFSLMWYQNTAGTLAAWSTFMSPFAGFAELSDFDQDGDTDVVYTSVGGTTGHIRWLENQGTSFVQQTLATGIDPAYRCDVGDIDGDGDLDVIFSSSGSALLQWISRY